MALAMRARKCLHAYGIHSATIQPEFDVAVGPAHASGGPHAAAPAFSLDGADPPPAAAAAASCLLDCVENCFEEGCCSKGSKPVSRPESSRSSKSGKHTAEDH